MYFKLMGKLYKTGDIPSWITCPLLTSPIQVFLLDYKKVHHFMNAASEHHFRKYFIRFSCYKSTLKNV